MCLQGVRNSSRGGGGDGWGVGQGGRGNGRRAPEPYEENYLFVACNKLWFSSGDFARTLTKEG